jgi:hypothetical protein
MLAPRAPAPMSVGAPIKLIILFMLGLWLLPALRAFTSLRDVSLRRNLGL